MQSQFTYFIFQKSFIIDMYCRYWMYIIIMYQITRQRESLEQYDYGKPSEKTDGIRFHSEFFENYVAVRMYMKMKGEDSTSAIPVRILIEISIL